MMNTNENLIIENALLKKQLNETKESLKYTLIQRDIGFMLANATSINEALSMIINQILKVKVINGAGIYLFNPETKNLELKAHSGLSPSFIEKTKFYTPQDIQYEIVKNGIPIYKKYSYVIQNSDKFKEEGLQYLGVVPVKMDNNVIGSVNIATVSQIDNNESLKSFLEESGKQMGAAIYRINTRQNIFMSSKNFKMLFNTVDELIFIFNAPGKIIMANPAAEKLLNYTGKELQKLYFPDLFPPDRRTEAVSFVKKIDQEKLNICLMPLLTQQEKKIPAEIRLVNGEWDGDKAYIAIAHDITEKIEAGQLLHKSEACWHFVLESFGDGMWDYNIKTGDLKYSNQCMQITGYDKDEVKGTMEEWLSAIHPDDVEKVKNNITAHLKGETAVFKIEYRLLCKDGTYKWLFDHGKVISYDENGYPERMIGIFIDLSLQKKLEISLEETLRKEQELNKLKSQFVSMASHEFRTPLATMLVAADAMVAYYDKMTREEMAAKVKRIKEQIIFLNKVIEKTMNLTQLESGKMKITRGSVELNRFLGIIIMEITMSPDHNHKIIFHKTDMPLIINTDTLILKEIINNLLTNSMKYSKPEDPVEVRLTKNEKYAIIEVSDKGIGVPDEDKDAVFEAFHRGSNVGGIRGTGLGLAISKRFVKTLGGKVYFESELNKGTKFFVLLPVREG